MNNLSDRNRLLSCLLKPGAQRKMHRFSLANLSGRKKKLFSGFILLFILFGSELHAQDWYNANWIYRKQIIIDYTKVSSNGAPHSNFPVLISLSSDANLSSNARADGYDILFTSGDGTTKLNHQRVSYSNGSLQAWVNIPSLSATANTVLYMYYGYASSADQQNSSATWNSNFKGVWHLEETSGTFYDASKYSKNGTDYVSASSKEGKIGKGQNFDGYNDFISLGTGCFTTWTTTVEFWVKPDCPANYDAVFIQGYHGCCNFQFRVFWYNGHFEVRASTYGAAGTPQAASGSVSNGCWSHIAMTFNGSSFKFYVNGVASSGTVCGYNVGLNGYNYIGRRNCTNHWDGSLDEIRVSNKARSAGWLKTCYNNQNNPTCFYSLSDEEVLDFSEGWYDCSWKNRKKIEIDYCKVGSTGAPHVDFPMLISLTDNDLKTQAKSNGYDILFTSDNGTTKLSHEIESYTAQSGSLLAWVKIPNLSSSKNTFIYMYYGNSGASNQQSTTSTWNSGFKGVWHLKESSGNFYDATSNNNYGLDWVSASGKEGKIGKGQNFDGIDDYISPVNTCFTTWATTVEFWVKPSTPSNYDAVFIQGSSACGSLQHRVFWYNGHFEVRASTSGCAGTPQAASGSVTDGAWSHIAWIFNGSTFKFYVNGVYSSGSVCGYNVGLNGYNYIGKRHATNHWDGSLDEIRISNTARSAGWIKTAYNNQNSPSSFYTVHEEEEATYYSQGNLAVNDPGSWNTYRNGKGADASNFCSGATWIIQNSHCMTLSNTDSWNVGSKGKIQIEDGGSWTNSSSGQVTVDSMILDNGSAYFHNTIASVPGTTKVFAEASNMYYSRSGSQNVEALNYGNLIISGSGTKTLKGNISPIGNLILDKGTFDLGSYMANRASGGGTLTLSNNTCLKIGGTSTFPSNYSTHVISCSSTIEYNGTSQSVVPLNSMQNYGNLTISGSGTKSLTGNIGIGGSLNISSGTFDLNSYTANRHTEGGTVNANALHSGGLDQSKTVYTTSSINPSANKLILLAVGRRGWGAISSVSGNNLSWVRVAGDYNGYGEGDNGVVLFRAMGTNPSSGAITITFAETQERANWSVVEFGNVDNSGNHGSGALVQKATSNTTGASTVTAWMPNAFGSTLNATYGVAVNGISTPTAGSGFTQLHQVNTGSDSNRINLISEWRTDNATQVKVNIGNTAATIIAVEIKAVPVGTLTLANGSTLKIGGTGTLPSNYINHYIGSSSTIEYDGTTQSVATLNSSQNYGHLIISGSETKTLAGDIGISGNLIISGGTFDLDGFSANRTSAGGSLSISNGKTLIIGGTATFPANFTTHSMGQSSTVEYDGTNQTVAELHSSQNYGNLIISGSGIKTLEGDVKTDKALTINNGTSLHVASDLFLTVEGTLTLNGEECLVLKADNSGYTGSLIEKGQVKGSGSLSFERFFSQKNWHYFTPVIQNTSSNNFWGAAVYSYNTNNVSWQAVGPNETLQKLTGYDVYFQTNTTVSFVGKPYTGSHNKSLVISSDNYNFVGNPYLSAIDWEASSGWTKNAVDNASYIWDPNQGGVSTYVNGNSTNGGSRYIAASQGFFVTVSSGGPYSLGLNVNARKHFRTKIRPEYENKNSLSLKLKDTEFSDETVVYFTENASDLFDGEYDALKMKESNPSRTIIYTKSSDDIDLSINSQHEIIKDQSIPLYLESGAAGSKDLSISGIEGFDTDLEVYLEDLKLNQIVDMKNGSYSFLYDPGDETNRFLLHFSLPSSLASQEMTNIEEDADHGFKDLKTFITEDELIIDLGQAADSRTDLYVFNILGKQIVYKEFNADGFEKVKLEGAAGYYLLKLVSGNEVYTTKVLKPISAQ